MNPQKEFLSDQQLLQVLALTDTAVAIHVTDKFIIQYANDAMLAIWAKGDGVIGLPLDVALPELEGQPFIDLFARVWNEGLTISGKNTLARLVVNGELKDFYFDFEYRAIKDKEGKTYCILHSANDVSERVAATKIAQGLSEELSAMNEELSSANEELIAANEELLQSQLSLQQTNEDLVESEFRFRNMVKQAPVGICVIRADDLFVQDVNDNYLELVGKDRSTMEGQTIWQAVPEAADVYAPIMNSVIKTGTPFYATEHKIVLVRNGSPEQIYIDFVYEPIKQGDGTVSAIMILGIEVTEKVVARRSIEEVEERVRLAVEAAEIGTFDLDIVNNTMLTSERFDTIFGFDHPVSWDEYSAVIHPEDKDVRSKAFADSFNTGKIFYEVRIIHPDQSVHWIRVQGNVSFNADKSPARLLGTLLDITQVKRLEQQKDDFISIASHELKTPITSLKASLQLLEKMKDNPSAAIFPNLIDQSVRSMKKVSSLIDDLLNVSRSNYAELKLHKTHFNLVNLLKNSCSHIRMGGKYTLTITGDSELMVFADEHAIDQVIVNLVNNAVKYAPDSMEIFLSVEKEVDMVKISVKDTGPGIPANKIPYLFDRYYQAESRGFQNSGLGLGLYICAGIVKRHNGKIGVNSEVGKGSAFWFTIPLGN